MPMKEHAPHRNHSHLSYRFYTTSACGVLPAHAAGYRRSVHMGMPIMCMPVMCMPITAMPIMAMPIMGMPIMCMPVMANARHAQVCPKEW